MFQQLLSLAAGSVAVAGAIAEDDRPYEWLSATLDGRVLVAFVDYQGTAVAVDLTGERPEIITGLAAGAVLSDLRDAAGEVDDGLVTVASGLGHSQVSVDGAIKVGRASRDQMLHVIDGLGAMPDLQRHQLKGLLGL